MPSYRHPAFAVAALITMVAGSASAASDPKSTTSATAATAGAAKEPSARKRFCLKTQVAPDAETRRVCKTYAEWQRQGIDPRGK